MIASSVLVYLFTDGCVALVKKEKRGSKQMEGGNAASWQQVLEYNTSQNAAGKLTSKTSAMEHADESKNTILDSRCEVSSSSVRVRSPEDERPLLKGPSDADTPDGRLSLPVPHAGQDGHKVDKLTAKSRSAQDLTKQPELPPSHHKSTESLLKGHGEVGHPVTLPQLDRLRKEDSAVLSRRRSFSGAVHKAATAVAVRYRGLRDSLKAVSADLLSGGRDGGEDELMLKSAKVSSNGQRTTTVILMTNNDDDDSFVLVTLHLH